MKRDLKSVLSPKDKDILGGTTGTTWVPDDPREVLYPYIPVEESSFEKNGLDDRRQKAQQVVDGYKKIEEECEELKAQISDRCKTVVIDLKAQDNLTVIDAVKRVFGTDGKTITFQMYQKCIEALNDRTNASLPEPTDKG